MEKWVAGIAAGVLVTIISVGIISEVVAFGERRELRMAVISLTKSVDQLTASEIAFKARYEQRHEDILLALEQVKARQSMMNKKMN